ncbi:hypothetical protein ACJJTC_019722 [Scirpophaga incertulas]
MNVRRLDALCVTELSKGSHTEELRVGIMALWSGVQQDEYASAGVGVVLSSRLGSDLERIKTEKLNDESIRSKYVGLVSERLANVNLADLDVDDCWNVLEESMVDSAKNVCGCAKRSKTMKSDAWWDAEVETSVA